MNKAELVAAMAEKAELSKKDAEWIQNFEQCESYTKPDVLWIALEHHLINSFNCSKRLHCTTPFSYKSDCLWNNFAYRP